MASPILSAACVLPVPDGGDTKPSPANVAGEITRIEGGTIFIKENSPGKTLAVSLPSDVNVYTAFGGVVSRGELKTGQRASVWLVGCKRSSKGMLTAAYFEIFSIDPKDVPSAPNNSLQGRRP